MQALSFESITVDEPDLQFLKEKGIRLAVLRVDKIHPLISGNKWFKLKYYLKDANKQGKDHLVTFGGAYSNHIVALAAAGRLCGFKTSGIIRGEKPQKLSPALQHATDCGMELFFMSREDYRDRKLPLEIKNADGVYVINQGGYGINGVEGASEILDYCQKQKYSHIGCAVGTSTMMAGLIKAGLPSQKIIGIPVLKNNITLEDELRGLLSPEEKNKRFQMIHGYDFGGYAKCNPHLIHFMNEFYKTTSIPTDFVYTGKLFYGIVDMIKNDLFPRGSSVLVVHSGGLQGNSSLPGGSLIF